MSSFHTRVFGCGFYSPGYGFDSRRYLPQVTLQAHTQIQSTASRTKLKQVFVNDTGDNISDIQYTFPLYDGVSVVAFKCTIGDKVIVGVVKERNEAKTQYDAAVARGEAAGLLEQMHEASDVFHTKLGNVPKNGEAVVEIEYVGELHHDAQLDGVRFTIPTVVGPRYGSLSKSYQSPFSNVSGSRIEITVDVEVDEGAHIEGISSPSHPIAMTLGRTSNEKTTFKSNRGSATLSSGAAELGKDFILVVNAQEQGIPKALLEEHPEIPGHKALMTTLVPKFNLPNIHPEIVFVVDRSGSMGGKIPMLVEALKVFLKSLPLSCKFNICSFGSKYSFLFKKSVPYDEKSLEKALADVQRFQADFGGTELLRPIQETVKNRLGSVPLEIMVLTDGEIWNQQEAFDFVNGAAQSDVRLFSLGIGAGASTALVEGLARAGKGFAQFVQDNEKMDKRVVRMLKAALSPHIDDYRLEVKFSETEAASDDDFEIVESTKIDEKNPPAYQKEDKSQDPISLFDSNFEETSTNPATGRYDHLPSLKPPKELQAPTQISGLFPYSRTSAYILLPDCARKITSVVLKGTYNKRPVQLEIPIQNVGVGKTIHQLAAKKAMLDTEEGRGWLSNAKAENGKSLKSKYEADWERIIEREAVRLGVQFQVAGKYCSFIAVETVANREAEVIDVLVSRPKPIESQQRARFDMSQTLLFGGGFSSTSNYAPPPPPSGSRSFQQMAFGAPAAHGGSSLFGNVGGNLGARSRMAAMATPQSQSATPVMKSRKSSSKGFGFGAPPPPSAPNKSMSDKLLRSKKKETSGFTAATVFARADADQDESEDEGFSIADEGYSTKSTSTTARQGTNSTETKMHKLIGLQRFDGSWTPGDELFKLTEVWKEDFKDANIKYEDGTIRATLLAIAWFEKHAAKDMEVWEMVVDKAKQWLSSQNRVVDVDEAVRQAMTVFFP